MRITALLSIAVLMASGLLAQAQGALSKSHVQAEMVSFSQKDADAPALVGIRLTIEPGWHIYWKNPGDSGMATRVQWKAPKGSVLKAAEFPTTTKFVHPGNITGNEVHRRRQRLE